MKNPEEYLKDFYNGIFYELHSGDVDDIIKYIRKAQIDAYNEALEDAIKNIEAAIWQESVELEIIGNQADYLINNANISQSILKLKR